MNTLFTKNNPPYKTSSFTYLWDGDARTSLQLGDVLVYFPKKEELRIYRPCEEDAINAQCRLLKVGNNLKNASEVWKMPGDSFKVSCQMSFATGLKPELQNWIIADDPSEKNIYRMINPE